MNPPRPDHPRGERRPDAPVLPHRPAADRDETWGDRPGERDRDLDWYRRERPPHHE